MPCSSGASILHPPCPIEIKQAAETHCKACIREYGWSKWSWPTSYKFMDEYRKKIGIKLLMTTERGPYLLATFNNDTNNIALHLRQSKVQGIYIQSQNMGIIIANIIKFDYMMGFLQKKMSKSSKWLASLRLLKTIQTNR